MVTTSLPTATPSSRTLLWSHAAAFGALWGSIEVTLGAFLHVLRLPLAGVLLASLGALLLVAARQVFPRRGTTLATGLVAALCKSLSPGGIILGPMIGIFTEAVLVEAALVIAPRSRFSALVAGLLCALWAACQKVLSQYVFYGKSVIELYLVALGRARDWLELPPGSGWWAAGILLTVVALVGATAGLLGHGVGRRAGEVLSGGATVSDAR